MSAFSAELVADEQLGRVVQLACGNLTRPERSLQVQIAPAYGSNLVQLRVGSYDIFATDRAALANGGWTGCFVLWPLPNRHELDGEKAYEFGGRVVSLDDIVRKPDDRYLIHGLVDNQSWHAHPPQVRADCASVTTTIVIEPDGELYQYFPWESSLSLTYTLRADRLEVAYEARNLSDRPMPHTFALHPYYGLPAGPESVRVRIAAESRMVANAKTVPTGEVRPVDGTEYDLREPTVVGDLRLDDVWTGMAPGESAYVEYADPPLRVRHEVTPDFTHAVLYTLMAKDLGFVCLEPQTGASNAINLDACARRTGDAALAEAAHLLVVPPGGVQRGMVAFMVEH